MSDDLIARLESAVKQYDTYPDGVINNADALWIVVQHAQHICAEAAAALRERDAEIALLTSAAHKDARTIKERTEEVCREHARAERAHIQARARRR